MGYSNPDMVELVRRKIESIHIANGDDGYYDKGDNRLVFLTDKGPLAYATSGDCCSDTWFADILGVAFLIGGTVRSVEDVEMPSPLDTRKRSDHDQNYGIKITTDLGIADIIYRNASNGYYGGECGQTYDVSLENTRPITADWSSN